ncbi:MAG TPA: HAD family phosphatase [Candidatus Saccharimonadales bacterium]
MIKAVLFDFGGVLTETGKRGYITGVVAEILGLPPETVDIADLHADLRRGNIQEADFFAAINQRYAKNKQLTKDEFVAKTELVNLSPQVMDLARQLPRHGIVTGILSNVFSVNAERLRARGYYDGFDPVFLSCEIGYAKPDPGIYKYVLEKLNVRPQEILFIDDQEKCTEPARALGMHVVLAMSPDQIVADVKAILKIENDIDL